MSDKPPSRANDINDLMKEALEDYVGLWELVFQADQRIFDDAEVRAETLAMARILLNRGLVMGNLINGAFIVWDQQHADSVIDRIEQEWDSLGPNGSVYNIGWFNFPCDGPGN